MLIIGSFANLVVIDVFLNMLYYLLIFVAAIRLRQKEPGLERPFRIWGNTAILAAICAPAVFIALLTLYTNAIDTSTDDLRPRFVLGLRLHLRLVRHRRRARDARRAGRLRDLQDAPWGAGRSTP